MPKNTRLRALLVTSAAGYGLGIYGMNELWYKNSPRSAFHFFNDAGEWQQVDKAGHCYTAFFESMYAVKILQWSGLPQKKAIFWGSMTGILLQSPIELLDGFSSSYGASVSDLAANIVGSGLVLSQYVVWKEIRIQPKFSFHTTAFAPQRPAVLGKSFIEQVLKDYNGQTYWLSLNMYSFLKNGSKFPKWLNLSLGYGAENMLFADKELNKYTRQDVYRQYFISLDIDLTKIKSRSKILNTILYNFNLLHFPAPAIELNKFGIRLHALYF